MFSYHTPEWKIKFNIRKLSLVMTVIYVAAVIPMLIMGFYNWPSVDDFSMAYQPHVYFEETGNIFGTIGAAFSKTVYLYNNWVGYFFSSFLTCICPSVFSEKLYFVVPFIILGIVTLGVCYFYKSLFVICWKLDRYLSHAISMLTLIVLVNSLESGNARAEAFYWYSGAINYSFMFGLSLLWIGLLIRTAFDTERSSGILKIVAASVLGFLLGGANYMSALGMAICSGLIIFILVMIKLGKFKAECENTKLLWIPAVMNILGLAISAIAPGNALRASQSGTMGPIKSVFVSVYYVFDMCMSDMTRWEVVVVLLIIAVLSWKLGAGMKSRLQHPLLFGMFAFLITASSMTPPLYAVGNIAAGRVHSLVWMEYIVMLVLSVFYYTVWIRQRLYGLSLVAEDDKLTVNESLLITILAGFIYIGSLLNVMVDPWYYTGSSAIYDVVTGRAAQYYSECVARYDILSDDSISEAVFDRYTVEPELLFYQDVTADPNEWVNQITAEYYDKEKVYISEENSDK